MIRLHLLTEAKHNTALQRWARAEAAYEPGRRVGLTGSPLQDLLLDQIAAQADLAASFVASGPGETCMETEGAHQIGTAVHCPITLDSDNTPSPMPTLLPSQPPNATSPSGR